MSIYQSSQTKKPAISPFNNQGIEIAGLNVLIFQPSYQSIKISVETGQRPFQQQSHHLPLNGHLCKA